MENKDIKLGNIYNLKNRKADDFKLFQGVDKKIRTKGWGFYGGVQKHIDNLEKITWKTNKVRGTEFAPFMINNTLRDCNFINELKNELKEKNVYIGDKQFFLNNLVAFQSFSYSLAVPLYSSIILNTGDEFFDYKKQIENINICSNIKSLTIIENRFENALKEIDLVINSLISKKIDTNLLTKKPVFIRQ